MTNRIEIETNRVEEKKIEKNLPKVSVDVLAYENSPSLVEAVKNCEWSGPSIVVSKQYWVESKISKWMKRKSNLSIFKAVKKKFIIEY